MLFYIHTIACGKTGISGQVIFQASLFHGKGDLRIPSQPKGTLPGVGKDFLTVVVGSSVRAVEPRFVGIKGLSQGKTWFVLRDKQKKSGEKLVSPGSPTATFVTTSLFLLFSVIGNEQKAVPLTWIPSFLRASSTDWLSLLRINPLSICTAITWSWFKARFRRAVHTVESTPPLSKT